MSLYAQIEMGSTTDYTEIEADGTIEFHGDATVWNDYVVPFSAVKTKNTKIPSWESFMGEIYQYAFDGSGTDQEVGFAIQMPHDWDGSAIYPHIHWSPSTDDGGAVVWGIEYTWVEYNDTAPLEFPATITSTTISEELSGDGHKHLITAFNAITPSGDQDNISSILVVRFFRNSSVTEDDYEHDAFALSFDIHYRLNTLGSREEFTK